MSCSFSFRTFVAFTAVCLLMESPVASAIVIARADTSDTPSVLGTLRGPDGQQHDLAAPRERAERLGLLLLRMPDLQRLQSDA